MIDQQEFRYEHSGGCQLILDAREKSTPDISIEDCYFLGFRLTCEGTIRYHRAWIIANNHEAFLRGMKAECASLPVQSPALGILEIDLVFMHNLRTRMPNYMNKEMQQEASARIGQTLCRRDDEHFAVLGVCNDQRFDVLDFKVKDALMAIRMTRSHSVKICGATLLPIVVCQAHPVTREFDALFLREAVLIQTLVCSTTAGVLH